MKKFIFKIDNKNNIIIEESRVKKFTQDDFLVYLNVGCIKYLLKQDSLFYSILSDFKLIFIKGYFEDKSNLPKKKKLSKILFEKGTEYFDDKLYLDNVFFDSNYLLLLTKYENEMYFEMAKINIFGEEHSYKLILCKKIQTDLMENWKTVFNQLETFSIKLQKKVLNDYVH